MEWEIENNVVSKLYYGATNLIKPWGFETADSSAFFSLEDGLGYRYSLNSIARNFSTKEYYIDMTCEMKEGSWHTVINDKIVSSTEINRNFHTEVLEDSYFMDYVMRFRFDKDIFYQANIDRLSLRHNNTNVYYQFPVREVTLNGNEFDIKISINDFQCPDSFEPVIYVRDQKGEWVVHVRMVPKIWHKEVIKLCVSWAGTRSIPDFISSFLLSSKRIKEELWYRGERAPYKNIFLRRFLNPCAFGMTLVPKHSVFSWDVNCKVLEHSEKGGF